MKVEFYNISWETDGHRVKLPKKIVLDVDSDLDVSLDGADVLSDNFGYLVNSFSFKIIT